MKTAKYNYKNMTNLYYKNGETYNPNAEEKLLIAIFPERNEVEHIIKTETFDFEVHFPSGISIKELDELLEKKCDQFGIDSFDVRRID